MAMRWTSELATGIPEMDLQHQQLYALADALHGAMREGDRTAVPPIVNRLRELAEAHFAEEERQMASLRYPRLPEQRVAHEGFVSDLRTFERALEGGVRASVMLDIAHFLVRWMRDHVRGSDVPFARWAARADRAAPVRVTPPTLRCGVRRLAPAASAA